MKYKSVNELDKFMFQDAEVKKMEFNPELMTIFNLIALYPMGGQALKALRDAGK